MDSENKEARCIGFIFGIGFFFIIFVLSYLMVSYPDMVAGNQAKKIAKSLSSIQSRINAQPTIISLSLPTDSFVYDAQGGGVVGDSLMSFNEGSHDLSFHVSYPNGSEQKSLEVRLSGARVGATYTLTKETKDDTVRSVQFRVFGLDTALVWYVDGKRVMPSEDGSVEVSLPKYVDPARSSAHESLYFTCLVGYSAVDNSVRDGVIIRYDRK